jgi:beta-glucosidase
VSFTQCGVLQYESGPQTVRVHQQNFKEVVMAKSNAPLVQIGGSMLLVVALLGFTAENAHGTLSATSLVTQAKPNPISAEEAKRRSFELLRKMTVEEKAGQLNQAPGISRMPGGSGGGPDEAVRKGLVGSVLWLSNTREINRLQHIAVDESRLHIPLLFGLDVIHGYRINFPLPLAMAASWSPELAEQAQRAAAEDARAAGINWTFTPMVDIARDARWGRIVEGAGEDPYLGSAMARAQVRGLQGASLGPSSLLACVKHFAGYGAADGGRDYDSSYIPEVTLRNVYLAPFRAAIEAGVGTVMTAYMDLNDVPATGNKFLLREILRDEWGFQGFVVSDAMAVRSLVTHGFAKDAEDAALRAVSAGVNVDMASGVLLEQVPKLAAAGRIAEADLDKLVLPILEAKFRLGLFDSPFVDESRTETTLDRASTRDLARRIGAKSMVLLRNDGGTLPLSKSLKRIALVGPFAETGTALEGGWTVEGLFGGTSKSRPVSLLEGLKNKLGPTAQIDVVSGPSPQKKYPGMFEGFMGRKPEPEPTAAEIKSVIESAVTAARGADAVIAVLGETPTMSGESASRATLNLPGFQQELIEAVSATGKPLVAVVVSGRPLDLLWASEHVPSILQAWYPGTEGGNAIADVLFGDVNPGGKLPVTWPRSAGQEPLFYNHNLTHQPENSPRFTSRYWDLSSSPIYPFGYGLSYSTFTYENLRLDKARVQTADIVQVLVDVTNTGRVAGDTVAQLYIHQRAGSASRPVRELKGFRRFTLAPGEKQTVSFRLSKDELSFWSPATRVWAVEPGVFDVWVGEDSTAKLHAELEIVKN